MQIAFHSSAGPSLGVEVELELVDVRTGELVSAASEILAEIGRGHPDGVHPKAKHELFECCIEVITGVCTSVAEAKAELGTACNIVIRPSGTEPIVRVMVQHPELRTADRVCKELGDKVKAL